MCVEKCSYYNASLSPTVVSVPETMASLSKGKDSKSKKMTSAVTVEQIQEDRLTQVRNVNMCNS